MDKISIPEIRAKFPMYADMEDDQLLIAIRRKYYPDIKPAQFYSKVEYTAPDPTEGMSEFDKLRAGVGKGLSDAALGLKQMFGQASQGDVAESRRLDKPLLKTGSGMAGNVLGSVAALAPTALIPGAATLRGAAMIGAGTGLAAPSESAQETIGNTALGGALGPGSLLLGRGLGAAVSGGRGLVEPFTKTGQEAIAARTLQQFASNPAKAAENMRTAPTLVPGSRPTMAQAADDSGLAQLERTLRNNPETGPLIQSQIDAQRAARLGAVQDIAGQDSFYQGIKEGRQVFASEDYAKAIAAGFDANGLAKNADKLNQILQRPSVRSAQQVARNLAAENGEQLTELGSVRGLDYMVKALDNKISAATGVGSSVGKEELRALTKTKAELLDVVEQIAPAYKEARQNFAAMSRQINSMDVARDVMTRMQSPLARAGANGRELKNAYAAALESAMESTKRSTGLDLPASAFMPERDLKTLQNVAKDMARSANAEDAGRAIGSNTAQNLAAQNLLRRTLGPTGMPQSWSESNVLQAFLAPYTGLSKLAGSERAVLDRLTKAATDPADAANLLSMTEVPSRLGLLGNQSLRYAPTIPLGLLGQPPQ